MAEILGGSGLGRAAFAANAVAPLARFAAPGLSSLLFAQPRRIGVLIPGVVLEEDGRDELEVTQHPVERGAPITDHSYMRPAELVMRCAWGSAQFGPAYLRAIYAALLALQASREPMTISTGKRTYRNMLIRSISVTTSGPQDENILNVTCVFQEVLFAETQATTVAPRGQQAQPHNTAPPGNVGTITPIAAGRDDI